MNDGTCLNGDVIDVVAALMDVVMLFDGKYSACIHFPGTFIAKMAFAISSEMLIKSFEDADKRLEKFFKDRHDIHYLHFAVNSSDADDTDAGKGKDKGKETYRHHAVINTDPNVAHPSYRHWQSVVVPLQGEHVFGLDSFNRSLVLPEAFEAVIKYINWSKLLKSKWPRAVTSVSGL